MCANVCDARSAWVKKARAIISRLAKQRKTSNVLCVDSGSIHHLLQDQNCFIPYKPLEDKYILAANDSPLQVAGISTVEATLAGHAVRLKSCYHVPSLTMPLLLVIVVEEMGATL